MERGHHRHPERSPFRAAERDLMHHAPEARDAELRPEEELGRGTAEGDDHLRPNERELREQIRPAALDLMRKRRSILERSRLQHVRDVDIPAREPHRADHLVELLARGPHERSTGGVLGLAGSLSDEHDFGVGISLTEDEVRVPRGLSAVRALLGMEHAERLKTRGFVGFAGGAERRRDAILDLEDGSWAGLVKAG